MAEDTIIHRTFWDSTKFARPGYDQPDTFFGSPHKARQPVEGSFSGYQFIGGELRPVDLIKKPYQDFAKSCTTFERYWSALVDYPGYRFDPVVGPHDEFGQGYPVVGHVGKCDGSVILVPRGYYGENLGRILGKGVPAFVWGFTDEWTSTGNWELFASAEERFTVQTSVDGTILKYLAYDVVGLEEEDPIMDLIVGKVLADVGIYGVKKLIGGLVRRAWGPIVTAETRLKLLKEALAKKEGRAAGKLTTEEMTTHLVGVVGEHPELRRLMAARVLSEQRLTSATLEATGEWARARPGRSVVWKSEAELVKRTGDPKNLMTLQGNELWINQQAKVLKDPKVFYREVVHELAADSLGIRGIGMAKVYLQLPNGTTFSDLTLLENAVLRGNVEEVVRFFGGK